MTGNIDWEYRSKHGAPHWELTETRPLVFGAVKEAGEVFTASEYRAIMDDEPVTTKGNKMDIKKCGICGKEMGDGTRNLIGLSISVKIATFTPEWTELVKRQFGKFYPTREYAMCYECWLAGLGFKPDAPTYER